LLFHLLDKYSEAEPLLKAALTRDPDDPALNTQYAAVLAAQGKSDEALASLEKHRADLTPISGLHHPMVIGKAHNAAVYSRR